MLTALLDGDIIAHRAASAVQSTYQWDNGTESVSADFFSARDKAQELIGEWAGAIYADRVIVALSDPTGNYWRRQVLPTYKAQRSGVRKPVLYTNLREWMIQHYEVVVFPGCEGDDVLGVYGTHPKIKGTKVIVSSDKDMLGVPALLYRPHRKADGIIQVTQEAADRFHLIQTLSGDATDGFYGIRGVGPKKAEKILDAAPYPHTTHSSQCPCTPWDKVVRAYQRAGLTEQDAITQSRVARILRAGEYHRGVGVKLWSPA